MPAEFYLGFKRLHRAQKKTKHKEMMFALNADPLKAVSQSRVTEMEPAQKLNPLEAIWNFCSGSATPAAENGRASAQPFTAVRLQGYWHTLALHALLT